MRKLCLLAAFAAFAVQVMTAGGERPLAVEPGIDTMPPVVSSQSLPCGVRELTATETRNIPDPPRATPNERDQVERGIQQIRLALDPASSNVSLTLVNPTAFPNNPKVTTATFRVALVDASKAGSAVVEVRDWANMITRTVVSIAAATPSASASAINVGLIKVGQVGQGTVTITNNTDGPMTLTSITLANGQRFAITAGGTTPVNLPVGGTQTVAFSYTPVIGSEAGDADNLRVETACGNVTVALSGTGGVSRILTATNTLSFNIDATNKPKDCEATEGMLKIANTGNVDMVVSGITSSNPKFTISSPTVPALPITIAPATSVDVATICFEDQAMSTETGTLTIATDATDNSDNTVSLNGNSTVSVEDEIGATARVWFDAANDQIVFSTVVANTPVTIHDISGRVIAASTVSDAGSFRVSTASWNNGIVMITYSDANGQRTRSLSIVR